VGEHRREVGYLEGLFSSVKGIPFFCYAGIKEKEGLESGNDIEIMT